MPKENATEPTKVSVCQKFFMSDLRILEVSFRKAHYHVFSVVRAVQSPPAEDKSCLLSHFLVDISHRWIAHTAAVPRSMWKCRVNSWSIFTLTGQTRPDFFRFCFVCFCFVFIEFAQQLGVGYIGIHFFYLQPMGPSSA